MIADSSTTQYHKCPVCSNAIRRWRTKSVSNEIYQLDKCNTCGYTFVNPRPTLKFLMDFYDSFGHKQLQQKPKIPDLASVTQAEREDPNSTIDATRMISTVQSLLTPSSGKRFLDIGCGYGFFSNQALAAGYDVTALELAKNERKIAEKMTGLSASSLAFENFECPGESLSVVFMSQILEHAFDINLWMEKSHQFLEKNGIIAIALPNFGSIFRLILQENEPFICPPAHLNFFNPNSLSKLLNKHGFEVEKTQWVSRIPTRAFAKRIPVFAKPALPVINAASRTSLKLIDAAHLGMFINVYGRKK